MFLKIHWRYGFSGCPKFNNALLARQVWRLIHHRDTLFYKVFNARYFPNGSTLNAPVHPKCSYAWSILQAREVIDKRAIWQVGDGQKIEVWKHRWLPDPAYSQIVSPRAGSSVVQVCDLFHANTRIWDLGRLESCLLPWEADMVRQIHVSDAWTEDILIWPLNMDGEYSVRSAYCMLVEADGQALPSSSSSNNYQTFWKKIWKIKVPKIRHFVWQAVKDSLPTKQNLKAQHIQVDETCDQCGDHPEDILHCLWLCDEARTIWRSDPGFQFLHRKNCRSFFDLVTVLLTEGSGYRISLFAKIASCIWQRHNRLRERQPS